MALIITGFIFSPTLSRAASITLAWSPSPTPTVVGYELFYGLASEDYSDAVDAGTNLSITLSGLTGGVTYYLSVLAYDSTGNSSLFSNEVIQNTGPDESEAPPVITATPASQTVAAGTTAALAVSAESAGPVGYQWYLGSTALDGATNATLILPNVSEADSGDYSVAVSNALGSVMSDAATLSVIALPGITTQPVSQSCLPGASISFYVGVSGTPPFTIQWYDGGTAVPTGTKATLHLDNISNANAGNYSVVISNSGGSVTSLVATLSVINPIGPGGGITSSPIQEAAGAVPNITTPLSTPTVPLSFIPLAGAYNGLFYQTNGGVLPDINLQSAGLLANCVVGTNGTYSAHLRLGGFKYHLAGTLDMSGFDSEVVSRAGRGLSNLNVTLQLDMTGASGQMTGLVSNMDAANPWTAALLADLATNALPVVAGNFNIMLTPSQSAASNDPSNFLGTGLLISSTTGIVTCSALLPDGTSVSQSVPLAKDGTIPFYASLYSGQGIAEGWINLANGVASGSITWIRPGQTIIWQNGQPITTVLSVQSSQNPSLPITDPNSEVR